MKKILIYGLFGGQSVICAGISIAIWGDLVNHVDPDHVAGTAFAALGLAFAALALVLDEDGER